MMGITGFIYWTIKSIFTASWAMNIRDLDITDNIYLRWSFAKNSLRSIGIVFQLYFFVKLDPSIGCREEIRRKKIMYFLLPALKLSLLAVFIATIIDSYNGLVEELIAHSGINNILLALMHAGEPLHLGFCLHLCLHIFFISDNMKDRKGYVARQPGEQIENNISMATLATTNSTQTDNRNGTANLENNLQ